MNKIYKYDTQIFHISRGLDRIKDNSKRLYILFLVSSPRSQKSYFRRQDNHYTHTEGVGNEVYKVNKKTGRPLKTLSEQIFLTFFGSNKYFFRNNKRYLTFIYTMSLYLFTNELKMDLKTPKKRNSQTNKNIIEDRG